MFVHVVRSDDLLSVFVKNKQEDESISGRNGHMYMASTFCASDFVSVTLRLTQIDRTERSVPERY